MRRIEEEKEIEEVGRGRHEGKKRGGGEEENRKVEGEVERE